MKGQEGGARVMVLHRVVKILQANDRRLAWLAKESGVPYSRLYRLMKGEYADIRVAEAEAIADALRVPADILFEGIAVFPDDPQANTLGRRVLPRRRSLHVAGRRQGSEGAA